MFLKYSRETITTKPRFEVTKEIATSSRIRAILPIRFNSDLIYCACPKWLLPELSSRFLPQARRIVGSGDENGDSLVLQCAFLLRTIFASLARANERARTKRDFPQTKLDSVINARFLFNERGDPPFLFYKFNENHILSNWEKNWQKSMATFLTNEINATDS